MGFRLKSETQVVDVFPRKDLEKGYSARLLGCRGTRGCCVSATRYMKGGQVLVDVGVPTRQCHPVPASSRPVVPGQ